jgi:hypothetical protein
VNLSYLIVEVDADSFEGMRLEEGVWKQSSYSDYFYRVDSARPEMSLRRHIHIAHKRHLDAPTQQVSWNSDCTRHDQRTFADHFKGLEKAKQIARTVLKLGDDAVLESVSHKRKADWLVECVLEGTSLPPSELLEVPLLVLKAKPLTKLKRALQILETMERREKKRSH